jgi:predicted RNA-binding protein with TRAM domain
LLWCTSQNYAVVNPLTIFYNFLTKIWDVTVSSVPLMFYFRSSFPYIRGRRKMVLSVTNMSYGRDRDNSGYGGNRGGFGGGRSPMGPKPVEVGKQYDVEVTELSRRGDGVAKVQGFVIFVQGAKVGQKVKIKVDRVGPRFASATVVGGAAAGGSESASTETSESGSDESMAESTADTDDSSA